MPDIYSVDSSALIHGWRRVYRPKNFPVIWERLDTLIDAGRLKMSVEVLRELEKKDDELHVWCRERAARLALEIDDDCQVTVGRLMGTYPRLVDTVKGRSGADPFVIAVALNGRPKMVVVSQETPGRQKIPDVCTAEQVECIGLADLIERENWQFG